MIRRKRAKAEAPGAALARLLRAVDAVLEDPALCEVNARLRDELAEARRALLPGYP